MRSILFAHPEEKREAILHNNCVLFLFFLGGIVQKRVKSFAGEIKGERTARHYMNEEPGNIDLDTLTEETARKIIWTLQPGATTGDPLPTIKQLLYNFLDSAREQEYQDAIHQEDNEE